MDLTCIIKKVTDRSILIWIFSVNPPPPPPTDLTPPPPPPPHHNGYAKYKRRNVLTHARVNFSQSETSLLLGGGWGGVNRKDPVILLGTRGIIQLINFELIISNNTLFYTFSTTFDYATSNYI